MRDPSQFALERLPGRLLPNASDPREAWGILNPGSARTSSNELLLFPRAVAEGNYSRIAIVRVSGGGGGGLGHAERLGFALEPETSYERDARGVGGGVEDPRVTYVTELKLYVMAYTALGRFGPRIALASSPDGWRWQRLGLVQFEDKRSLLNSFGNKDAVLFPRTVKGPNKRDCLVILHRPTYLIHHANGTVERRIPPEVADERPSIWMSYIPLDAAQRDPQNLARLHGSQPLITPEEPWEVLKVGAGTPPILTEDGWVLYYHGVSGEEDSEPGAPKNVSYKVGVLLLNTEDPSQVVYRSPRPVFEPTGEDERVGIVNNVVFPTAVDVREQVVDVYYGAADTRIGVATTEFTSRILLPPSAPSTARYSS